MGSTSASRLAKAIATASIGMALLGAGRATASPSEPDPSPGGSSDAGSSSSSTEFLPSESGPSSDLGSSSGSESSSGTGNSSSSGPEIGGIFADVYRILHPISQGGMGAVYAAEQLATGAHRALKLMHRDLIADGRGFLLPWRDVDAAVVALQRLRDDRAELRRHALAYQAFVRDNFSAESFAARLDGILSEVLAHVA